MNYAIILKYWPLLWQGFLLTIALAAAILTVSTVFALLIALGRQSSHRPISFAAAAYTNTFRAVPVLVVLYFSFYALPQLGLVLQSVTAAIVGLSVASTAYLSEDIRSGLVAIDRGQHQAAKALGLGYLHTVRRIILPQAIPIMLAPYMTRAIIIVKATSLGAIVTVNELTGQAYGLISITYTAFEFFTVAALLYLLLNGLLALVQVYAERRLALH